MKNFNYYEDYDNDYYDDDYCDIYVKKQKISKSHKKKSKHEEDLFSSKSGKKKKKDYKKLQKEIEKMKLDAVNNLFFDDEEE